MFDAIKQPNKKTSSDFSSEPLAEHDVARQSLGQIYRRRWPERKYSMRSSNEAIKEVKISLQKLSLNKV